MGNLGLAARDERESYVCTRERGGDTNARITTKLLLWIRIIIFDEINCNDNEHYFSLIYALSFIRYVYVYVFVMCPSIHSDYTRVRLICAQSIREKN